MICPHVKVMSVDCTYEPASVFQCRPEVTNSLWRLEPGIRTHFGPSSPVPRSLDAGLSAATCTGSYSTHTGGMITSGCPGSSPRTPKRKRRSVKEGKSSVSSEDGRTVYRLKWDHRPGLSPGWAAGNPWSEWRRVCHCCRRRRDATWTKRQECRAALVE